MYNGSHALILWTHPNITKTKSRTSYNNKKKMIQGLKKIIFFIGFLINI